MFCILSLRMYFSEICVIDDVCAYLRKLFRLSCFGTCGRLDPFEDPEDVEGLLDECGDELMLTHR